MFGVLRATDYILNLKGVSNLNYIPNMFKYFEVSFVYNLFTLSRAKRNELLVKNDKIHVQI